MKHNYSISNRTHSLCLAFSRVSLFQQKKSIPVMTTNSHHRIFLAFLTCVIVTTINVWSAAQNVFPSPKFEEATILSSPGKQLSFTLSNLPDPKTHGDSDGALDVQINWQLGDGCEAGSSFSERVKITSTTHRFNTGYKLSSADNRKKLRVAVSYVKPTGNEEMPAKGLIAASQECVTLKISKN